MKSLVNYLAELLSVLLEDVEQLHGNLSGLGRDRSRLLSIMERREIGFFLTVLPSYAKHIDRCVADGRLTPSNLPHLRPRKKGGKIPRLFGGLVERLFHENGGLRDDFDSEVYRSLRQLLLVCKKVDYDCAQRARYETAREWFEIEHNIQPDTSGWSYDDPDFSTCPTLTESFGQYTESACTGLPQLPLETKSVAVDAVPREILDTVQRVADRIVSQFGSPFMGELCPKPGPGAVSERVKDKFSFTHWPRKLDTVFPFEANGSPSLDFHDGWYPDSSEPPSRLLAVPKTYSGPRLIAAEPLAHQYMQQAIFRFLDQRILKGSLRQTIRLRDQTRNQDWALASSSTRRHATIDLSSASDRISCRLIESIFRSNQDLLYAFHAVRTRWVVNEVDKRLPRFHKLRKFSTQGSALTFPVQSIVFSILCIGTLLFRERLPVTGPNIRWASREIRVYGDDLVVPTHITAMLTALLSVLGLKVNPSKSFSSGNFRESCGMDAFDGTDVSPVYIRKPSMEFQPSAVISCIDTSNSFHRKGYWRTAQYVLDNLGIPLRDLAIIGVGSGAFGLISFCGYRPKGSPRWNSDLQKEERLVLTPQAKSKVLMAEGGSHLLQYFVEKPDPLTLWKSGTRVRPSTRLVRRWVATERLREILS